jgi:3-deoxy-D-manno-octulosonic-acid transferase
MRHLPFFYTVFLSAAALVSVPFWGMALASKSRHRAGFLQKITGRVPKRWPSSKRPIWYHAVSVGEVMASLPLIQEMLRRFPDRRVWISTVTATGQATARSRVSRAAEIFYFPYDLPWIIDRVIRSLDPALFISTETEIWPNCIWRLKQKGVQALLVNGRISDRSFVWYKRFRFFFRQVLEGFDLLCMQSEESARRIHGMGAPRERVRVTGNLKFDLDLPNPSDLKLWRARLGLSENDRVLVAGSTHPGEEALVLRAFKRLRKPYPELRLVLAPRAPERFDTVEGIVAQEGLSVVRRSQLRGKERAEVILLDTMGELSQIYGLAEVGFVGGSLVPRGGHNPLEVAAHSRPVIFGPHMENFRDIASLLVEGHAAAEVSNGEELGHRIQAILGEPSARTKMGDRGFEILWSNRGAVERTLAAIEQLLTGTPSWA